MLRNNCIVCDSAISPINSADMPRHTVDCPVCGQYVASRALLDDQLNPAVIPTGERYLISAWIKWHSLRGMDPPTLSEEVCKSAIADAPSYTPIERMEQFLLSMAIRSGLPGKRLRTEPSLEYPYAWAAIPAECMAYLGWLQELGYLTFANGSALVTRKGWERATELQRDFQHSGRRAFVAMWFDDSFDSVWAEGLRPGIRDAGYEPYRIKEDIHNERIDFRIIAAIRASRFLVADVSEPRTAVYYEAGFAEGLGKLVIWTCREDRLKGLSFDTRQFRHVAWRDPVDLRGQLSATIQALLPL